MTDNLKKFLRKAQEDDTISSQLEALNQEQEKDVVIKKTMEIAAKANITLTPEDFEQSGEEMSDDEMMSVAGGIKKCCCSLGGGGTGRGGDKTCACVVEGFGLYKNNSIRCACSIGGIGDAT